MVKKIALREVRMLKVCTVHYNNTKLSCLSLGTNYMFHCNRSTYMAFLQCICSLGLYN